MLSKNELREIVIASLRDLCGDGDAEITDRTNPKEDLELDSEHGVEFACEVSERMGKLLPNDVNPFVDDKTEGIRNVGAIVDLLAELQTRLPPTENQL